MSIVIKGMQMPETCEECMFAGWSNLHQTAVCNLLGWKILFDDFSKEYKSKRADDCPLVGLPKKHGRLMDKDEFLERLSKTDQSFSFFHSGVYVDVSDFKSLLIDMPVVIEAEGDT